MVAYPLPSKFPGKSRPCNHQLSITTREGLPPVLIATRLQDCTQYRTAHLTHDFCPQARPVSPSGYSRKRPPSCCSAPKDSRPLSRALNPTSHATLSFSRRRSSHYQPSDLKHYLLPRPLCLSPSPSFHLRLLSYTFYQAFSSPAHHDTHTYMEAQQWI